jgi:Flp pilus assembly protein TadB
VTGLLVAVAAACAVVAWPVRTDPRRRLADLPGPGRPLPRPERSSVSPVLLLLAAVAVVAVVVADGLPAWWLAAAPVAVAVRRRRAPTPEDVALLVDLLAACLAAGVPPADAAEATAAVATGPRGGSLATVAERLRAGAPPHEAWAAWAADAELGPVARACTRAAGSGAAVAAEIGRAAERIRKARAARTERRVAAAGVWIVLPLGLCFLPAFVLVGVVPIAVGLLGRVG